MATTRTLYSTAYAIFSTRGGTRYTADANGVIVNVTTNDARDLVNAGASYIPIVGGDGLVTTTFRLTDGLTPAGIGMAVSPAAGVFGISSTLGTSLGLLGEIATSNTKTDDVLFEHPLPSSYVAGQNLSVAINAQTKGAGTAGTATLAVKAYRIASDGTQGASIGAVAQAITGVAAVYTFAITGTTLNPGDRVGVEVETVIQETTGGNLQSQINSIKVG